MAWWDDIIAEIGRAVGDAVTSIRNWISSNISEVENYLYTLTSWIGQQIGGGLSQVGNTIASTTSALVSNINAVQTNIASTINQTANSLSRAIDDGLADVSYAQYNVANWLNSQINSGLASVQQSVGSIANGVSTAIDNGLRAVETTVGGIGSTVGAAINTGLASVQQAVGGIAAQIGNAIGGALTQVSAGLDALGASIGTGIQTALETVGTAISTAQEFVGTQLANLSPDLTAIADAISAANPLAPIYDAAIKRIEDELKLSRQEATDLFTKKLNTLARAARGDYKNLDALMNDLTDPAPLVGAVAGVVFMILIAPAIGQVVGSAISPMTIPIQQAILERMQPVALTPAELAATVVQGYSTQDAAAKEAALSGLTRARFDQLFNIAGEPPGLGELLQLLNRNYMTDAEVTKAIQESRLKPKYTETVKKLRWILPPLQDVIRMGVREAWRDDVAAKYGYDEDTPPALAETAPKLGVDPDWMKRYWRAHWELPAITMVLEMLHRTAETGITPADVEEFLRVQDVPKYWRDKIRAVSYAPYTRVDVRRMYKTRVLDQNGVLNAYRALGYDEVRAKNLTEFTVRLQDEIGQLNPDTLERKQYTALETLFVSDKRGEGDLTSAMQKFGWGQQAIDAELEIARLRREAHKKIEDRDISGLSITTLQRRIVERQIDLYARGAGSLGDVQAAMSEFGWGDDVAELLTRAATLESMLAVSPTRRQSLRELSISAILEAFESHTFTEPQTLERLQQIGLSAEDAKTEIQIKQYQIASKLRNQIVSALKSAFMASEISETDLGIQLAKYGFAPDEVSGYAALWTVEKSLQRKRFTEAQLATFMKHDVITVDQYATELQHQGYDDQQVSWWLALRGAT